MTKYIPHVPTVKQHAFLLMNHVIEGFFGGSAGGGKSDALLMAALQYVDKPGYHAILFRDTFANLAGEGGLLPRSHEWLRDTDAYWKGTEKKWLFPSGATISFGHMKTPLDHFNYQSHEYQFVGFDEMVQVRENQATYMFSRMRRKAGSSVPLRFRGASNPPAREQVKTGAWVKKRYIDSPNTNERFFLPSRLSDNPYVDQEAYIKNLNFLDPITRKQLLDGDWNVQATSDLFDLSKIKIIDQVPRNVKYAEIRFWDLASTEEEPGKDPDYTAGAKLLINLEDSSIIIEHIRRRRDSPVKIERLIQQIAGMDGHACPIKIEQEPGSAGKALISHFKRNILAGYFCQGFYVTGDKISYALPFSSMVDLGMVSMVRGVWNAPFLDELELFPFGEHDDQCDAVFKAYNVLTDGKRAGVF